jgi:hypothetical protein
MPHEMYTYVTLDGEAYHISNACLEGLFTATTYSIGMSAHSWIHINASTARFQGTLSSYRLLSRVATAMQPTLFEFRVSIHHSCGRI